MYTLPNQFVNNVDIKEFTFKKLLLATLVQGRNFRHSDGTFPKITQHIRPKNIRFGAVIGLTEFHGEKQHREGGTFSQIDCANGGKTPFASLHPI